IEDDGPGAGVEDIPLGFAKLNVALMRSIPAQPVPGVTQMPVTAANGPAQNNVDVRLGDIKIGAGSLMAVYMYGSSGSAGSQTGEQKWAPLSGNQLSLIHDRPLLGGNNTFVVQYGMGIYGGDAGDDSSALTEYGDWGSQSIAQTDPDAK